MTRAQRLGAGFIALCWLALLAALAAALPEAAGLMRDWRAFAAQARVATRVLEDPINQYDPLLGWKHIPGKSVAMDAAFPGEGIVFEINGNGFRGSRDYAPETPSARYRVIAVGDSFTFGNVRNADTWPSRLEQRDPRLEVINMGASSYGLDQMYLWYREDGLRFEADLVICAVIEKDFQRVFLHKWPSGHARPKFDLVDGDLRLTNVPVPRRIEPGEANLHPADFAAFLYQRFGWGAPRARGDPALPFAVLSAFHELVTGRGIRFVVVYLPTLPDFESERGFRHGLGEATRRAGIPLLDLTGTVLARTGGNFQSIFRSDRHYNAQGNQLVAEALYEKLHLDRPSVDPPPRAPATRNQAREGPGAPPSP